MRSTDHQSGQGLTNSSSKGSHNPYLWNVMILTGSLVLSFFLAEGILALLEPEKLRVEHRGFYEYDPLLGWKKKCNAQRVNRTEEFLATELTNSEGMRGPNYSIEKNPNEYRVLILGDSFAEGYTVDFENLFSELLKKKLNQQSDNIFFEVINAGTVGYGTDQEFLLFEKLGKQYSPDVVILLFYQNDPADNTCRNEIYGNYKPVFKLENGNLILSHSPPPGSRPDDAAPIKNPLSSHWQLAKQSRVFRLLDTKLSDWNWKVGELKDKRKLPYELNFFSTVPSPEISEAWRITELLLVNLKKSVEASGACFLLYYVPGLAQLDPDTWERMKTEYGMIGNHWNSGQVEHELKQICDKHSIHCMGGAQEFEDVSQSIGLKARSLYYLKDGHWNALGHKMVGESLANRLLPLTGKECSPSKHCSALGNSQF